MINCFAMERESLWGGKATFLLNSILDVFESNPYTKFEKMDFNSEIRFKSYNREKLIQVLAENADKEVSVMLEAENPFPVSANISLEQSYKLLQINVDENYLNEENAGLQMINFLQRLTRTLPDFHWGRINAFENIADFYAQNSLAPLPECFNYYLGWFSLLHPKGYKPFYNQKDLLKIPAFRIDNLPDENLAIWAYDKPLQFSETSNKQKIVQITKYLNALSNEL
ncbi:MAG: hypothetical protein H7Z37_17110 [Pyrinomonadaceae bacterium]|nr:hypothetical protein [Pyrinomonadaceae bacterium]